MYLCPKGQVIDQLLGKYAINFCVSTYPTGVAYMPLSNSGIATLLMLELATAEFLNQFAPWMSCLNKKYFQLWWIIKQYSLIHACVHI